MDGRRRERLWLRVGHEVTRHGVTWPQAVCAVTSEVTAAGAAITLRTESGSRAEDLIAASELWVSELEQSQYTVGEGPGVEAFATGGPVMVADVAGQAARWPAFADAARSMDVAAVYAFPLQVGAIRLGTLDLYRRTLGFLSPADLGDVTTLADLATIAIMRSSTHTDPADEMQPEPPGGSYQDVHIATGMLAALLNVSLQDASVRLRAHAFSEGRPLLEVARDVLAYRIPLEQWST